MKPSKTNDYRERLFVARSFIVEVINDLVKDDSSRMEDWEDISQLVDILLHLNHTLYEYNP